MFYREGQTVPSNEREMRPSSTRQAGWEEQTGEGLVCSPAVTKTKSLLKCYSRKRPEFIFHE